MGQAVQEEQLLDCLALEDGTDKLSRNVGNKIPFHAAQNPKRAQISFTLRQKPEITHKTQTAHLHF
jgi:hypothetical protein